MKMVWKSVWILLSLFPMSFFPAFAHGPDQPPHRIADLGELVLESGEVLKTLRMSYVTHGTLNAAKDNAVLFLHGFAANHHLADHLIGPGKPLDTDKYFIICSDSLGNTQTGFEHSTSPTSSGLKMAFPVYNTRDMVKAEYTLLTQGLAIPHLRAVTGISMGAQKALQLAVSYPDFMDGIIPVVGGALWSTEVVLTMRQLQSIIELCGGWQNGHYETNPRECAAAALRSLVPSLYTRAWWNEQITTPAAFQHWEQTWDSAIGGQDARDLYLLAKALGRTTVADTPGFHGDLSAALHAIKAKTLFIVSPEDEFLPPQYTEIQHRAIAQSRVVSIDSDAGHFICCGADPQATWILGEAIRGFLRELDAAKATGQ
jgi:homoserine O-acetyltransferase